MEFVLDYKKWRCGNNSSIAKNRHGVGFTQLLNTQGYMCCLGQFEKQTGKKNAQIRWLDEPGNLERSFFKCKIGDYNSNLAIDAININDNTLTTIPEKIQKLKTRFQKNGHKIRFKNFPKWVKEEKPNLEYI